MRFLSIVMILAPAGSAMGDTPSDPPTNRVVAKEATMTARGQFDVEVIPQDPDGEAAGPFGRFLLDKTYHGALDAISRGQMLAFRTEAEGSGGYTALEQVTGTLNGRRGSFVLLHHGLMVHGETTDWGVTVVPDSGTGELTGLTGTMEIVIADGVHGYTFHYALGGE